MLDGPATRAHNAEPITAINDPFLNRIRYRNDDYSSLRYKLLEILEEALPAWRGRIGQNQSGEDFGVAFVEMFSYLADVLGFYQDCRANEAFFRTAVLPSSLIALCELIDYRIPQGASASVLQVFECKPGQAGTIPAGYQVKTKAKDGKPAFVFETAREIQADATRNRLHIQGWNRSTRVLNPSGGARVSSILLDSGYAGLETGSYCVLQKSATQEYAVRLTAVVEESEKRRIHFDPDAVPAGAAIAAANLTILGKPKQAMRLAAAARADEVVAGAVELDVVNAGAFAAVHRILIVAPGVFIPAIVVGKSGNTLLIDRPLPLAIRRSEAEVYTAGRDGFAFRGTRILPGTTVFTSDAPYFAPPSPGDVMILSGSGANGVPVLEAVRVANYNAVDRAYTLAAPLSNNFENATLFRLRLANAYTGDAGTAHTSLTSQRLGAASKEFVLDKTYDGLKPAQSLVAAAGAVQKVLHVESVAVDGNSRTVVRTVETLGGQPAVSAFRLHGPFELTMRVDGFDRSETVLPAGTSRVAIEEGTAGLAPPNYLVLESPSGTESLRIVSLDASGADVFPPTSFAHPIADAVLYGNVAEASHGETVVEAALGSGNAAIPNQTLTLHKKPLAFLHDASGSRGVRSTLDLFVNDELWRQVESLADARPGDHVYELRIDDAGVPSVRCGDDVHGARFPSGVNNIRARYRFGAGAAANVPAGEVSQMPDKLSFLASTFNPSAAAGGADPETTEQSRRNAPVTARTLDRAVTAADYRDLALAYTGIAKAAAYWTRKANRDVIRLVVAATGGKPLTAPLKAELAAYLAERSAPGPFLDIEDYRPWPVRLNIEVRAQANFARNAVQQAVLAALSAETGYFQFERRGLGQDLYLSEVYSMVEAIPGVDYLVARAFHGESEAPAVKNRIEVPAEAVATGGSATDPASGLLQLLVTGGIQ